MPKTVLAKGMKPFGAAAQQATDFRDYRSFNRVKRIEVRYSGVPSRNPTQDVHDARAAQLAGESIGNGLEQKMGGRIPEIVDVGFNVNAIDAVDRPPVFLVKG
jgi:hypothetical protein